MRMLAVQPWRAVQRAASTQVGPVRRAVTRFFDGAGDYTASVGTGRVSLVLQDLSRDLSIAGVAAQRTLMRAFLTALTDAGNATVKSGLTPRLRTAERGVRTRLVFSFDETSAEALEWARNNAATLVTNITADAMERVRAIVVSGFHDKRPPRVIAKEIQQVVGLTKPQELKWRRLLLTDERAAQRYAKLAWQQRGMAIARTETLKAANEGQSQAWGQATKAGLLTGQEQREWITTADDRTCPICLPMDGQVVGLKGAFRLPDGSLVDNPPAHPLCRCAQGLTMRTPKPERS